ncbi:MAG: metallophosphoesterase [Deltaproteobacteria bacterium]|nr:metallophosphoesterase [Deltaproteobacteria bacterium]
MSVGPVAAGRALGLAGALLALAGCADRASERAARDLEVGRAEVGGVRFEVQGGLAAVRRAVAGEIELWAGAPVLDIAAQVDAGAVRSWTIEVRNAMPDARLQPLGAATGAAAVASGAALLATRRRFALELPAPASVRLRLAPEDADRSEPFRFAFVSDIQTGIDRFSEVLARIGADPAVRFVLSAGDLTQRGTSEQMERFQRELESLGVPYFSTLGNHDASDDTPWHRFFGRCSASFAFHQVQFTLLDTADATVAPLAYDWLEGWLREAGGRPQLFVAHVPPLDPAGLRGAGFGSRAEAGKLLGMLARGGVDLTLYGHIHGYYSFENVGIPAFVSGGGGAFEEKLDGVGRHFLLVDVDPDRGVSAVRRVDVD